MDKQKGNEMESNLIENILSNQERKEILGSIKSDGWTIGDLIDCDKYCNKINQRIANKWRSDWENAPMDGREVWVLKLEYVNNPYDKTTNKYKTYAASFLDCGQWCIDGYGYYDYDQLEGFFIIPEPPKD